MCPAPDFLGRPRPRRAGGGLFASLLAVAVDTASFAAIKTSFWAVTASFWAAAAAVYWKSIASVVDAGVFGLRPRFLVSPIGFRF